MRATWENDANWFIGLPVSPAGWWSELDELPKGSRAFTGSDLHMTVAFLGRCGREAALAAWEAAKVAVADPITISPGPVRPYGKVKRPSAYAVEPQAGREAVSDFIARYRDIILSAANAPQDPRAPRPHFTVARPRRDAHWRDREALAAWARGQKLPAVSIPIERIALYTWSRARGERLFEIVESRPINAGPGSE